MYERAPPKKTQNYLLEGGPLVVQASPFVSALRTNQYQCTSRWCCERLYSASVKFVWRLFQHVCPFYDGWVTCAPTHSLQSIQQFLTKNGMTLVPHPPYSPNLALNNFYLFPRWKSPQRKRFANTEEVKQKNSRSTKRYQNQFKNWNSDKTNHLNRCLASNGEYFEGDWSLNMSE